MNIKEFIEIRILGKPYIKLLTDKEKSYFLSSIDEGIFEKRLMNIDMTITQQMLTSFCNSSLDYILDPLNTTVRIAYFCLIWKKKCIGCCMIYMFPDYVEFMYLHISKEYRKKGYGLLFHSLLEKMVVSGSLMRIRCYETSIEGIKLAYRIGYKLTDVLQSGTKVFSKIKE